MILPVLFGFSNIHLSASLSVTTMKSLLYRYSSYHSSHAHLTARHSSSYWLYFDSSVRRDLLAKQMTLSLLSTFWTRVAPMPCWHASVWTSKGISQSGCPSTWSPIRSSLSASKDFFCVSVHSILPSFFGN